MGRTGAHNSSQHTGEMHNTVKSTKDYWRAKPLGDIGLHRTSPSLTSLEMLSREYRCSDTDRVRTEKDAKEFEGYLDLEAKYMEGNRLWL